MEIGSLNSAYFNNMLENTGSSTENIKNKLNSAKAAGKAPSDDELMEVCKEFEAYFMEQIFKNMKSSMVPKSEETSGSMATLKGYYEDEMMKEYAKSAAGQSTNGLAQMLFEQMKRNYSTTDIPSGKNDPAAETTESAAAAGTIQADEEHKQ